MKKTYFIYFTFAFSLSFLSPMKNSLSSGHFSDDYHCGDSQISSPLPQEESEPENDEIYEDYLRIAHTAKGRQRSKDFAKNAFDWGLRSLGAVNDPDFSDLQPGQLYTHHYLYALRAIADREDLTLDPLEEKRYFSKLTVEMSRLYGRLEDPNNEQRLEGPQKKKRDEVLHGLKTSEILFVLNNLQLFLDHHAKESDTDEDREKRRIRWLTTYWEYCNIANPSSVQSFLLAKMLYEHNFPNNSDREEERQRNREEALELLKQCYSNRPSRPSHQDSESDTESEDEEEGESIPQSLPASHAMPAPFTFRIKTFRTRRDELKHSIEASLSAGTDSDSELKVEETENQASTDSLPPGIDSDFELKTEETEDDSFHNPEVKSEPTEPQQKKKKRFHPEKNGKPWTDEDLFQLKDLAFKINPNTGKRYTNEEIGKIMGRSEHSIKRQKRIQKLTQKKEWSEENKQELRELYCSQKLPLRKIASQIGRTLTSTRRQIAKMNLPLLHSLRAFWGPEENKIFQQYIAMTNTRSEKKYTLSEIAEIIHIKTGKPKRSLAALRQKLDRLKKENKTSSRRASYTSWNEKEKELFQKYDGAINPYTGEPYTDDEIRKKISQESGAMVRSKNSIQHWRGRQKKRKLQNFQESSQSSAQKESTPESKVEKKKSRKAHKRRNPNPKTARASIKKESGQKHPASTTSQEQDRGDQRAGASRPSLRPGQFRKKKRVASSPVSSTTHKALSRPKKKKVKVTVRRTKRKPD